MKTQKKTKSSRSKQTNTASTPPPIFLHEGKAWTEENRFPWIVPKRIKIPEKQTALRYLGSKIKWSDHFSWTSFLKWAYDEFGGEAQLQLFQGPQGWRAVPAYQYESDSLHTDELELDELTEEQRADHDRVRKELFDLDFHLIGTYHSHANSSAFQSGTDANNEKDQDGLHITMGNLGSPVHSIDGRVYIDKEKYSDIIWSVFYEGFPDLPKTVDEKTNSNLIKAKLLEFTETPFPDWWKTRVVPDTRTSRFPVKKVNNNYYGHGTAWHDDERYKKILSELSPLDLYSTLNTLRLVKGSTIWQIIRILEEMMEDYEGNFLD